MNNTEDKPTPIKFEAKLFKISDWTILKLPESASSKLPSRGQVMVEGSLNQTPLKTALEPDGQGGHWFKVENSLLKNAKVKAGDTVELSIEVTKDWSEPEVPQDLEQALKSTPVAYSLWEEITPLARWDWIRWIRATKNPDTRKKRIEVALSKMKKGMRRPCCFNRNACTEPYVASTKWTLLEPNSIA